MDKKVPLIIVLLIAALAGGYFSYKFYTETQILTEDVLKLEKDKKSLSKKNKKIQANLEEANLRAKEIQSRMNAMKGQLDQFQVERDRFQKMYRQVADERDNLYETLQQAQSELERSQSAISTQTQVQPSPQKKPKDPVGTDSHWEDVVRRKAELETEREELLSQLRNRDLMVKEMESKAKDYDIQLKDLDRVKTELEAAIKFKERTMTILTKDLVKEREDRKVVIKELDKLKTENISLIREHKFLSRIQGDLEAKLKKSLDEKDILSRKVDEVETVLKDKALDIDSLQKQLSRSVTSAKDVLPQQAKAVALPPIVVKADNKPTQAVSTLEGKVMAVNEKEKFVIIDLGSTNGVKPGDSFKVVKSGKKIATLNVIETRKDISACDVKEASPSVRMKEGDIVKFQR